MSRKDEIAVKKHHDLVNMEYEDGLDSISTKIGLNFILIDHLKNTS